MLNDFGIELDGFPDRYLSMFKNIRRTRVKSYGTVIGEDNSNVYRFGKCMSGVARPNFATVEGAMIQIIFNHDSIPNPPE